MNPLLFAGVIIVAVIAGAHFGLWLGCVISGRRIATLRGEKSALYTEIADLEVENEQLRGVR